MANTGATSTAQVVKSVLEKIAATNPEGSTNNKYYEQLRVIMQLRKFDNETENAMLDVNSFWKLERDPLYKRGRQVAQEKALEEKRVIARDLKKEGLAIDFIARTTKLSIQEIESL